MGKTRDFHTILFSIDYEYTCIGELLLCILLSSSKRVLYFDVVIPLNIEAQYISGLSRYDKTFTSQYICGNSVCIFL